MPEVDPTISGAPPAAAPPVAPVPEVVRTGRGCTCEFCGCKLTGSGEIISMGEPAKKMRKANEEIETLESRIATLTSERDEAKQKLDAALLQVKDESKGLRYKLKGVR
jgi:hypothetical protein